MSTIVDNAEKSRFELVVDGSTVGVLDYGRRHGTVSLVRAFVLPDKREAGRGKELVQAVLDQLEADGQQALPICNFVQWVIEQEPRYQHLVPADAPPAMCPWRPSGMDLDTE